MSKRVYISADYAVNNGDCEVVEELQKWGKDNKHKVDYVDTAQVVSGSVANDADCRACDLKEEFNRQINASSAVIFIIGDKTASRTAGSSCKRNSAGMGANVHHISKMQMVQELAKYMEVHLYQDQMKMLEELIHTLISNMSLCRQRGRKEPLLLCIIH